MTQGGRPDASSHAQIEPYQSRGHCWFGFQISQFYLTLSFKFLGRLHANRDEFLLSGSKWL